MRKLRTGLTALLAILIALPPTTLRAFDHPGHMTTAAIALAEIERQRPDLIDVIGTLFNGEAPVKEAPELPEGYFDQLQDTTERRITLAGYRIADLILAAADQIEAEREFVGR